MHYDVPYYIAALLALDSVIGSVPCAAAFPRTNALNALSAGLSNVRSAVSSNVRNVRSTVSSNVRSTVSSRAPRAWALDSGPFEKHEGPIEKRFNNLDTNPNGSTFLWLPEDEYSGTTFFDTFGFFTGTDPTNGKVNYVNASTAWATGLVYVQDDGKVIMKGDNTTWLASGEYRNSVRISSKKQYNTGLFILDLDKAPWGCGVWPAWWTLGSGTWPYTGEIDILEGVHDNEHNQVTWHTAPGCYIQPNVSFTGTVLQDNGANYTTCDSTPQVGEGVKGCGILEWSRASYGPYFDAQGGGAFAMKWDENGISVWSFYRAAIPQDIVEGSPNPSNWGAPVAQLSSQMCDPISQYFVNHSIIFDITFCGDWAGNTYANTNCPGTCADRLIDPSNFVNASWTINSLKVYRKQLLNGRISDSGAVRHEGVFQQAALCWGYLLFIVVVTILV